MNVRYVLGAAAAIAGAAWLRNSVALREDLRWEDVSRPGKIATIAGQAIHYLDVGKGPAIVLVHGFGGQTYSFRALIPALAKSYRVIAVDLKGFGYSQHDARTGLSHGDQVGMLAALLDSLGVARARVVGHSMGGAVAQRFAATWPERVEALVLAASVVADGRFRRAPRLPAWLLRPVLPVLAGVASSRLLKAGYYDPAFADDEVRAEYLRPGRIKGSMDGLRAMMRDVRSDPPIDFSRLTMPVLLLYGAQDRVVPLSVAQRIRERIPQARLVVIERAAHLLLEERPTECARAILEFFDESRVRAGAPPIQASRQG